MNELHELCDAAYSDVAEVAKEARKKGGLIASGTLDAADKLAHMIKSIETVEAMNGSYGADEYNGRHDGYNARYGGRYYDDGYSRRSYREGGYSARRRDSMGRYRDGGEEVEDRLREAMNMAPDEQSREAIRRAMEQVKK